MGSSKIIMLSGVYLILGFYTVSFYQAERTNSITVEAVANTVQAEQLARTGISLALSKMGDKYSTPNFSENVTMSGGTIEYSAVRLGSQSTITSTATFNSREISMTALFTFDRGRWRITRIYAVPTAEIVG
ncbi:MAG: hypothetical protein WCX28_13485 [Bacteriovoracaceae bacterium]|nr:hypothetical protein [Bacteroidota bacterium]